MKFKISLFEAKNEQEHLREESLQYEKEAHLDELTMEKCEIEAYIEQVRTYLHLLYLPHEKSPCGGEVTVSMGFCNEQIAIELRQKWADEAFYRSKANGKNCWSGAEQREDMNTLFM